MTSLAQQLSVLKLKQKDEVVLPQRTKLSFLFDIKKAANIDDQTVYFLCQQGIQDLVKQVPSLGDKLSAYSATILNEQSVNFFRGSKTEEELKELDQHLKDIIKLLSGHLIETSAHKIIEFLVRIYEVQAYIKHDFIMAFLPFFETAYFLRAIQLVNVKSDEFFAFLHEFAYQGESVDQKIIIKALARNNAVVFAKYAQWLFQGQNESTQQNIHHKFLGKMLLEVILQSNTQEHLFSILPVLSQTMKSNFAELRHAGLLSIGKLCCHTTLSQEYCGAFLRQTLLVAKNNDDQKEIELSLQVLLIIVQYQNVQILNAQDFSIILNLPRIVKTLEKLAANFDLTRLLKAMSMTVSESELDQPIFNKILANQAIMNLKCTYAVVSAQLQVLMRSEENSQARKQLQTIRKHHLQAYNQTVLLHLRQTQDKDEKEALRKVLYQISGEQTPLLSAGNDDLSLLSAIGSNKKQIRVKALTSLCSPEVIKHISSNEAALIEIFLAQIIQRCQDDGESMELMLDALQNVLNKNSERQQDKVIFRAVEEMLHSSCQKKIYQESTNSKAAGILASLKVEENDVINQAVVCYFFGKKPIHLNEHSFLFEKNNDKKIKQNPEKSFDFLDTMLKSPRGYTDMEKAAYLMSQVASASQKESPLSKINSILSSLKKLEQSMKVQDVESMLSSILSVLPSREQMSTCAQTKQLGEKCIRKFILVTLQHKQRNSLFDLLRLHNLMFQEQFGSNDKLYCEFHILNALHQSKNTLKRTFSILYLADSTETKFVVDHPMIVSVILMLLADANTMVRAAALALANAVSVQPESKEVLGVFTNTEKPRSVKKVQKGTGLTPLKPQKAVLFLSELLKHESEIKQDSSQLATFLNKTKHSDMLEVLLRNLLDLPTFQLKTKMIEVLALVDKHSNVFAMTFADTINRLFNLRIILTQPKLGIDQETQSVEMLVSDEADMLMSLGVLVSRMALKESDIQVSAVKSLVIPLLNYLVNDFFKSSPSLNQNKLYQVETMTKQVAVECLFKDNILSKLENQDQTRVIRTYMNLQRELHVQQLKDAIKQALFDNSNSISSEAIQPLLFECSNAIAKSNFKEAQVELSLETLISLPCGTDTSLLPNLLSLLKGITIKLLDPENSSILFTSELCCQACIQIIDHNSATNAHALRVNKISDQVYGFLQNIVRAMTQCANEIVSIKEEDTSDPFNQFMQVVDAAALPASDEGQKQRLWDLLVTSMQAAKGLSQLLLKSQRTIDGNIGKQSEFLRTLSMFIGSLQKGKNNRSTTCVEMTQRMFKFFHLESLNAIRHDLSQELLPIQKAQIQDILSTYLECLIAVANANSKNHGLDSLLIQLIDTAGHQQFSHVALLLLFGHARGSASLSDTFQIESVALNFILELLKKSVQALGSLLPIQNLLLCLSTLPLSESTYESTETQLKILDQSLVNDAMAVRTWLSNKKSFIGDFQTTRSNRFIAMKCLDTWLQNDSELKFMLSQLAGADTSDEIKEQFYTIYLVLGIMKDEVNVYLQLKEHKKDKQNRAKDVKLSVIRLLNAIEKMQQTFNQMLSFQLHCSIVLKIMQLPKSAISLKSNAVQLLDEKTPDFHFDLAPERQSELTKTFDGVLDEAINFLSSKSTEKDLAKNQDKQKYAIALLALLAKTSCSYIVLEVQQVTVQLVLRLFKNQSQYPLILNSQVLLSCTHLFEVYQATILEYLPDYVSLVLEASERSHENESGEEFFQESFTKTVLKSILSIVTLFIKFLNATQLELLLKHTIIAHKYFGNDVEQILGVVSETAPAAIGLKTVFQAVFNCFDETLMSCNDMAHLPMQAIRFLKHLLTPCLTATTKQFAEEFTPKITQFFKSVSTLPQTYFKKNAHCDMLQLDEVEAEIVKAIQAFVIKLNEDQLGPVILSFVKWAQKSHKQQYGACELNLHRQILLFKVSSGILEQLGEYAVPFLRLQIDNIIKVMGDTIAMFRAVPFGSKKRVRPDQEVPMLQEASSQDGQGHTILKLLEQACLNTSLFFKFDTGAFVQADIFEQLAEPLIAELVTLNSMGAHFDGFIDNSVKPLIFEMVERINNDNLTIRLNTAILMKTRNEHHWTVRLAALKVVEHMFAKMGERYLIVLNDTLPFISEALEDEQPNVEAAAKEIVKKVETLTGETIQNYLK